ncbi:MAG: radical SAM protein [Phycisphaerae bacterium]|jgi:radical SAM superfamily enzyme YgiQ (UPF0313 family)
MELPPRVDGDRLLKAGECLDIRARLRRVAARHDLSAVVACAFDARTRVLPFFYSSTHMAPAGARAIGSALYDAGITRTRIVLQHWNPRFRPSRMMLEGRMPDLLLVSSMQIHSAACDGLLRDACRIDPASRPLIIAGGPKAIYEPWTLFSPDPADPWGADVVVTGEEYVLLNLLEVLLAERAPGEPLRSAFARARDQGALDAVPGLVYPRANGGGNVEELVDTGIQRLVADLDELPHPALGYPLLETPSRGTDLASRPLDSGKVRRYSPLGSLVFTAGCRFTCPYCPIPAYNQRQHRVKSAARIADEMTQLYQQYGFHFFFGTDDNFFNNKARTLAIVEALGRVEIAGRPLRRVIHWGTEVTVHDTLAMKEHLTTVRKAGAMALWLGVEDMTATFVKKGQSVDKTTEAFRLLRHEGIAPVPMLMHHDGQPLYTRKSHYGLLNQIRLLRKAGAVDVQVLTMTPAVGSRIYEEPFNAGQMIQAAAGRQVQPYMLDANYIVATTQPHPWRMQLRVALALMYFYNPLRLLISLIRPKSSRYLIDASVQVIGLLGLLYTLPRMLGWAMRLMIGPIRRYTQVPQPHTRLVGPNDTPPCHGVAPAPAADSPAAGDAPDPARGLLKR